MINDTPFDTRLDEVCRKKGIWAAAPYPGMCWILENVMCVDPSQIPVDGVNLKGYFRFRVGFYGEYIRTEEGTREREWVNWTNEEVSKLLEWYEFIPYAFRNGNK